MVYADGAVLDPFTVIQTGGVVGLLILIIVLGLKGMWVFGWQYRAKVEECEEWKSYALMSTNLAETLAKLSDLPHSGRPRP